MKTTLKKLKRGFTLLELTMAMGVGLAIGGETLAMVNQQMAFLKIFHAQSFLNEEAPMISAHLSKLLANAERFSLHASVEDAISVSNPRPRLSASPVALLKFREPDGSTRKGILSFENGALYYYVVPALGQLSQPQWTVTKKASNITFFVEDGIMRVRLVGPYNEEIIYSGSMR